MTSVNIFIEPHLSCSKLSYSLREDRLPQAINLVYKFFNPFISNGDSIVALISFSRSKHAVTFKNSYFSCVGAFFYRAMCLSVSSPPARIIQLLQKI